MSFISKSGADFLEESNAVRYLKGDHNCQKTRATSWIECNGIPESAKGLSCYSVKTPYSFKEKFFLNLPDAMDIAEGTRDCIFYHYVEKRRERITTEGKPFKQADTDDQTEADMIANFMQYESDDNCNWLIDTNYESYVISHAHLDADEQWSSSWDWLMPVVQECKCVEDADYVLIDAIDFSLCNSHFQGVYDAVINFIKHTSHGKGDV
jgi:hypothetical protein